MTVRFIHTGDWHIGKPFGNFSSSLAGELMAERLNVLGRIAAAARDHNVRDVLVAGDVFDSDTLPDVDVRRAIQRLGGETSCRWHLLPGNHDPHRNGGLWARLLRAGLPDNIRLCLTPEVTPFTDEAVLLPSPLRSRSPGDDPTVWMDRAESPPGVLRIGLAHGPVQGFGSDMSAAVTLDPNRVETAGLCYLALGDWHGQRKVSRACWYAGTPEPDRFVDNQSGHVLLVEINGRDDVAVTSIPTAGFSWTQMQANVHDSKDLARLDAKLFANEHSAHKTLVRLTLSGSLPLAEQAALHTWTTEMSSRLRDLDVDMDQIVWRASDGDFSLFEGDPMLLAAAQQLSATAASGSGALGDAANDALALLYAITAEVENGDSR